MSLTMENYKERIIDNEISENLKIFGAISIEGPKWCGKTWTALNHANSVSFLNDPSGISTEKELAEMDINLILDGDYPKLLDEWQEVPTIWDAVRFKCDCDKIKGKYILTGSATPVTKDIHHSGAGRICKMKMYTMSLYESGDSSGDVSLSDLFNNNLKNKRVNKVELYHLAELIVRGGWPESIGADINVAMKIAKSYINDVLDKDIIQIDGVQRNKDKMKMLLRSLARNETSTCTKALLLSDISNSDEDTFSRNTLDDYLDVLDKLYLTDNQKTYMYKIRSSSNVGKLPKRHFIDTSLPCAILNITPDKLMKDLNTFGLYFEAMVERDLRIYAESIGAELYYYRDNNTGLEVDAIIELFDGEYGAIEIKLGSNKIEEAATNLNKFYNSAEIKPKFMCVICGLYDVVVKRPDGIYIVPITALKN